MHDDLQAEQPQRRGMSSTAKVLLVLGSIAGVCMLACCGGVAFVGFKFKDVIKAVAESTSTDPAVVKQRTAEIIQIDIPEEFAPVLTIGGALAGYSMKECIYHRAGNQNSGLVIMETNQPPGQDPKQQREAMLQKMRESQQMGSMNIDIQEESRESRGFTINGEEVPFEFIKGKAHGVPTRKVVGIFSGRQGTVMLILVVAESDYKDEQVVNMIKSIRLPGGAAPAVSGESDEPTDKMPENSEEMDGETESSPERASP